VLGVALAISLTMVLVCGGSIGGLLIFLSRRGQSVAQQAQAVIQQAGVQTLPMVQPAPVYDWMTDRVLAPVYTAALDEVGSNPEVIEQLGEPIEPLEDADELYRRIDSGALNPTGEKIQFDVKGSKEGAVVTVVAGTEAASGAPGMAYSAYRATEITVTFRDGSSVKVPPPKDQPGTKIQ
jgi:hypothetical protein